MTLGSKALWRFALIVSCVCPVWGQAPAALTVQSATSKQVVLSWSGTAANYNVQRAPLGGSYATIATVSATSYTDTSIDAYTTYQYQVTNGSAASASVTVGPPPAGTSNAAPAPVVGSTPAPGYGYNIATALDGNGDPAFLFIWDDPNGDSDRTDTALMFRSWNRAQYSWNPVVKLGTVGNVATNRRPATSLAYDASTHAFAAVSEAQQGDAFAIPLYVSTDGGMTWTLKNTITSASDQLAGPSLALAQGNLYLAYVEDNVGLHYLTGTLSQDPTTWTSKSQPAFPGTGLAQYNVGPSLALDSAGNPGIAYWVQPTGNTANEALLFWKPASGAAPVKIMDAPTDDFSVVKLAYAGLNPRVAVYALAAANNYDGLRVAASNDGGITWQPSVLIPPDGHSSTDYPFDMALNSAGGAAVAFGQNSGSGDAQCGNPKVSRSSDLANFTTCSFSTPDQGFSGYPGSIQDVFGGNDKLYVLWMEDNDAANTGVMMYREPPASAPTGPAISSVVDGASFRPNIVAGSWVTIMGANLSSTTRIWNSGDFNNGNVLPTSLDGVSVKINGMDAAVYYISPSQVNVQAPAPLSGPVTVQVTHSGAVSNTVTANAVANLPALFAYSAGSKTYPAAVFLNGLIVGDPSISGNAVAKAKPGDIIEFYATGITTSPAGSIIGAPIAYGSPLTMTIGGANATVQFTGLVAPGEFQINAVVPNLGSGEYPVVITTAGQSSQTGVVVPVQ